MPAPDAVGRAGACHGDVLRSGGDNFTKAHEDEFGKLISHSVEDFSPRSCQSFCAKKFGNLRNWLWSDCDAGTWGASVAGTLGKELTIGLELERVL
jgi:hypothetical protein